MSKSSGVSGRRGSLRTFRHSGLKNSETQSSSSSAVTATKTYDAFGNLLGSTGTWSGAFGYAAGYGYQEDASGLKLLGHRYYDSSTGRFLTRDPAKDGSNWYAYCENDPLRRFDPDGRNWLGQKWKEFVEYVKDKLDGGESPMPKLPPDDEINPEEGGWGAKLTEVLEYFKEVADDSEPWNHGMDPKPISEASSRLMLIPIQVMADSVQTTHPAPKDYPGKDAIVGAIPKGDAIESDLPGYSFGEPLAWAGVSRSSLGWHW